MKKNRFTKIVATLGPASQSPEMIEALFDKGVTIFRLNFSHGTHENHATVYETIRQIEDKKNHPICIIADLQGPKLRITSFASKKIHLTVGQAFRLDLNPDPGDETRVCLPHPEIFEVLETGAKLLLDDGKVQLEVKKHGNDFADCIVIAGKTLSDRKGVNVPGLILPISSLTEKDQNDLAFALDLGVDFIALSFVQRPQDIAEARRLIAGRASLIVKLEKPSAIDYLDELIDLSDALMVARGDLGVELPAEDVPTLQKRIIHKSRMAGKPVIVATQMLESMISSPTPTRAEASDVATAVYDGADAVMLSAETASGEFPLEAVSYMDRITRRVEEDEEYQQQIQMRTLESDHNLADAITTAAIDVAQKIEAAALVTYTTSGFTTLRAARERPHVQILSMTSNLKTARRLCLCYAVYPVICKDIKEFIEITELASEVAVGHDLAHKGQRLVVTAGIPFGTPGNTNVLRVSWV